MLTNCDSRLARLWVDQCPRCRQPGGGRKVRRLDLLRAQDVEYAFAGGQQIVGNDAPVASPPHRFRTHDGAGLPLSHGPQGFQTCPELLRGGIIGVVPEAGIFPVSIRRFLAVFAPPSQPAQTGEVTISNPELSEGSGQCLSVELGIGPGTRNGADIGKRFDLRGGKQVHELIERTRRMADGEEARRFRSPVVA